MSWLRIDDEFEDHPKLELLGNDAHRLWVRAACWCKKKANIHTAGFVPRALLEKIAKHAAPLPKLLTLADELVKANGAGMYEHGLWEVVDGGWRFHDWCDYQPPEKEEALSRSEAGRIAGLRSAEARRERNGTAQPRSSDVRPNVVPNDLPNEHRTTLPRTHLERPEPPVPVPVPVPVPEEEAAARAERFSLGPTWQPSAATLASLSVALIPDWALAQLIGRHRSHFCGKPSDVRTDEQWNQSLSKWVFRDWSNPERRPKREDLEPEKVELASLSDVDRMLGIA